MTTLPGPRIFFILGIALLAFVLTSAAAAALQPETAEPMARASASTPEPLATPERPREAAEQGPTTPPRPDALTGDPLFSPGLAFLKAAGVLLLIIGLILLIATVLRKLGVHHGPGGRGELLKIIETAPLGPRKYLAVVEAAGEYFLLGVSDQQVNLVSRLENREAVGRALRSRSAGPGGGNSGFAAILANLRRPANSAGER